MIKKLTDASKPLEFQNTINDISHRLNSTITNCILEIPQTINLEIEPNTYETVGTLTSALPYAVNGSLTNSDNVFSGFSIENYISLNEYFIPNKNSWEITTKITTAETLSATNHIFGIDDFSLMVGINIDTNTFLLTVGNNTASWNIGYVVGTHSVQVSTNYWLRVKFTGTAYVLEYSTNGTDYTQDVVIESTENLLAGILNFGLYSPETYYFEGSIDLNATQIKINSELWWSNATDKDVLTGFSDTTNYVKSVDTFKSESNAWEMVTKITTGSIGSNVQTIFVTGNYGCRFNITNSGKFHLSLGNDGTSFNIGYVEGTYAVQPNVTYWLKVKFTGEVYTLEYSIDNVNFVEDILIESTESISQNVGFIFGCSVTAYAFLGSIDFSETYININNELWWKAKPQYLILKAGSKVYVPNGFNENGSKRFDEVLIESDLKADTTNYSGMYAVFYNGEKVINLTIIRDCVSGSEPSSPISLQGWYDTDNNSIKRYRNDIGWQPYLTSLPIAYLTSDGKYFTSIDKVFNGFGYIGSTIFALPNVKGLIPNYRNDDGTLNNIYVELEEVAVKDVSGAGKDQEYIFSITPSGKIDYLRSLGSSKIPPITVGDSYNFCYFNTLDNMWYRTRGSTTADWKAYYQVEAGKFILDEDKKFTLFEPQLPFSIGTGFLPLEGGVMTGDIEMDTAYIKRVDDSGTLELYGGTDYYDGASLHLMGANATISKGGFQLVTKNAESTATLVGSSNGNLSWNGSRVVTSAGATFDGDIVMNTAYIKRVDDTGRLELYGGTDYAKGCSLCLMGAESTITKGGFQLITHNGTKSATLIGTPDGNLSWNGASLVQGMNPIGSLLIMGANIAPTGYILCNGAAIDRDLYYELFEVIGTTYGVGDGSTTFNLPNYTNRFIMGHTTAGTVKAAGLPNATGTLAVSDAEITGTGVFKNTGGSGLTYGNARISQNSISFSLSNSNSIYGKSTTVQPPALTARIYIKY